ncbi:TonB-dependent receptor [Pacificimonas sp. ICDLI1SI03]
MRSTNFTLTSVSLLLCSAGTAIVAASPAMAQAQPVTSTASPGTEGLTEIVVTAQRREESLQDAEVSVLAFDEDDIEAKGLYDITDLDNFAPALEVTPHPNSTGTAQIFIRGVGLNEDQITQDPSVATYLDGVYLGRSQGLANDLADIARIEVLRGPQGTLYGRNATGGAVNFITVAPELEELGVRQQVTLGSRDLLRLKTSVNIPLGQTAAARLTYLKVEQDGFIDNVGTGVERFGDRDRQGWRADLLWEPTPDLSLRYSYDHSELDDTPGFIGRVPLYPETAPLPEEGSEFVSGLQRNKVRADGHTLLAEWSINPSTTFKSITSFRDLETFQNQNYLAGVLGPFPLFVTADDVNQEQFSQELQILGDFGPAFEYVVGAYYFEEQAENVDNLEDQLQETDNSSYALFAQGTYTPPILDERLHLTLGLRWSQDDRYAFLSEDGVSADGDESFSNLSPTFIAAYDVTDDVNLYGKIAAGYKTGGFNTRASSLARFSDGFDEETLTAYEIGLKSEFWDRRARFNLAAFYSDYTDIQVNVQSVANDPTVTDVLNAGKARIKGVEADLTLAPGAGLEASLSYAYLDPEYVEIIDAAGVDVSSGFRFINSPAHSFSGNISYTLPPTPIGDLRADLTYSWRDEQFASSTVNRGELIIDNYGLLGARLSLSEIPGLNGVRAALWGRNLTDEVYYLAHFSLGVPAAYFGEPRTFGVDLFFDF